MPKPEFTSNPPTKAPNDKLPSTNNSLKSKLEAQLGISPTMHEYRGVKYRFESRNDLNVSSPIKPITKPRIKLITKT